MNDRSKAATVPLVFEQLLDATERLWATKPPSEITMRAISEEAGLSLGLAYNYVNSQEELFGVVLERMAERLSAAAREGTEPGESLQSLWTAMEATPGFQRLMTWLVLEGVNVSKIMQRHPVIADLSNHMSSQRGDDPGLIAGVTAFCGISMQTFEVLVNRAMGRDESDPALREAILTMFAHWAARRVDP